MTKEELSKARELATNEDVDLAAETGQIDIFNGYALPDFKPVYVTIEMVAALIRWEALWFNGNLDANALNAIAAAGRKKFLVL